MRTIVFGLVARDVQADEPLLEHTLAYAQVESESERTCGFHVGFVAPEARTMVADLLADIVADRPDDPNMDHLFMPRYELTVMDGMPDVECMHASIRLTPMGDGGTVVETGVPVWLDDAAANAAGTILHVMCEAARGGERLMLRFAPVMGCTRMPDEHRMLLLGFTRDNRSIWSAVSPVGPGEWRMSLHVEIDAKTGDWGLVVLDGDTGESYEWWRQIPPIRDRFAMDIRDRLRLLRHNGLSNMRLPTDPGGRMRTV